MTGVKSHIACRDLKRLEILTVPCENIFSLINFLTNNDYFQTNGDVHSASTRHKHYLHKPNANLPCFQRSTYYAGIKMFNNLPPDLTSFKVENTQFKTALKRHLNTHSFYSVELIV
jgi:hypothetical protein